MRRVAAQRIPIRSTVIDDRFENQRNGQLMNLHRWMTDKLERSGNDSSGPHSKNRPGERLLRRVTVRSVRFQSRWG